MNSFLAISILMVIAPCYARAQDIRFEAGVTNAHVDALVKQAGQTPHGLTKDDFIIRDGGKAQPILAFEEETVPLDLILILDGPLFSQYGDLENHVNKEAAAAKASLSQMRAQDRTAVIFGRGPRVEQELSSDRTAITAALERAGGGLARFNVPSLEIRSLTIQWAAWLLAADAKTQSSTSAGERKRAALMITEDTWRSWIPDEPVIRQLWSMDVALNVLIVPADHPRAQVFAPRIDNMEHIAKATGGDFVVVEKGTLEKSLSDLLARIRSTYSMWYRMPESKSGELHHITVELSDEAKKKYPNAEIKAREGYVAP